MRTTICLLALVLARGTAVANPVAHELPDAEAERWIAAAQSQKADDGATILQVLRYTQQARPDRFKFGEFDVGYNDDNGEPDAVMLEVWIGQKRRPDDVRDIMIPIKRAGGKPTVAIPPVSGVFLDALHKGRYALVQAIDEEYAAVCVESKTRTKIC